MTETSLCYLLKGRSILMLYRNKKDHDINHGKWIGVGGKRENNETFEACAKRETYEETGYVCHSLHYCGRLEFLFAGGEDEISYVYSCRDFSGTMKACDEGELAWIDIDQLGSLPMWEGDTYFMHRLEEETPFVLTLSYDASFNLVKVEERKETL
jgi:8-oxo-dGTP diphosphatase